VSATLRKFEAASEGNIDENMEKRIP